MLRSLITVMLSMLVAALSAQDCKVQMPELQGEYSGNCKKGLAHGQGKVKGDKVTYEGNFKKGYPQGKGVIQYLEDDRVFKGQFKEGRIYGFGQVFQSDSLVKEGYWKGDLMNYRYLGIEEADLKGYKILQEDNLGQAKLKISRSDNNSELITIRLNDLKNRSIADISVEERNNGQIAKSTFTNSRSFVEINAIEFPFIITIRYTVSSGQSNNFTVPVILRLEIFESGDWLINITH
ncbi:hypothetical protein FNH22_02475 [Fulvivirga sp. M361]|uniref:hypothetical protein n=1 Tax=Fulvivirga sp. M361 TaxID=2594266 RepID=UPI00117AE1F9|nr:hypothetical protein [Fulvivirga sp. M361]TRX62205.1 hypothetical protein FNH22_02475 [Fulvivirga sp. M361]